MVTEQVVAKNAPTIDLSSLMKQKMMICNIQAAHRPTSAAKFTEFNNNFENLVRL
jgi:hypothetical protein